MLDIREHTVCTWRSCWCGKLCKQKQCVYCVNLLLCQASPCLSANTTGQVLFVPACLELKLTQPVYLRTMCSALPHGKLLPLSQDSPSSIAFICVVFFFFLSFLTLSFIFCLPLLNCSRQLPGGLLFPSRMLIYWVTTKDSRAEWYRIFDHQTYPWMSLPSCAVSATNSSAVICVGALVEQKTIQEPL